MKRSWLRVDAILTICLLAGLMSGLVPSAMAAYTDNFDDLLVELQARSVILEGSTDPVERRQKKACDKSIAAIMKEADSLADDLKTQRKVALTLTRAFPDELARGFAPGGAIPGDLDVLLGGSFDGLLADVQADLDALQTSIDALPAGPAKDKAQAQADLAADLIADANAAVSHADAAKILGAANKAVVKGEKIVAHGSGGGGCNSGSSLSMLIDGQPFTAAVAGGEYVTSDGLFAVGGQTGGSTYDAVAIILLNGVSGTGTYALDLHSSFVRGATYTGPPAEVFTVTTGSITITDLNTGNHYAKGTFFFTAVGTFGTTDTINVTQGQVEICNLTVKP